MPPHQNSPITPSSLITVKVLHQGVTRRYRLQYRELSPDSFPSRIRHILAIRDDEEIVIERYSDSSASYVLIESGNLAAYRQLARAAKAKSKLLIRVAVPARIEAAAANNPEQTKKQLEGPVIVSSSPISPNTTERPGHLDTASTVSSAVATAATATAAATPASTVIDAKAEKVEKAMDLPLSDSNSPCWVDCNKCGKRTSECHYHCDECDNGDFDLCPFCIDSGVTCHDKSHLLVKRFMRDGLIVNQGKINEKPAASPRAIAEPLQKEKVKTSDVKPVSESVPRQTTCQVQTPAKTSGDRTPVAVPQWVCNGCVREFPESDSFVTCLNCLSFDLCLECLVKDKHGHNPLHEFRLNNKNEMTTYRSQEITKLCRPGRNLIHDAYCDGCDKRINGIRHKCLDCPDWDFCDSCAKSARINHPGHRFAKLTNGIDLHWKSEPVHKGILCDGPFCAHSQKYITGIRYKCTVCHDTDFCQICEAHPSTRHNETHPLIKIRTPVASLSVTTVNESAKLKNAVSMGDMGKEKKASSHESTSSTSSVIDAATQVEASVGQSAKTEQKKPVQEAPEAKPRPQHSEPAAPLNGIFVGDTVPDGSKVYADQSFTQTWSVFNPGPRPWPKGVAVHYVGGDTMFDVDMTRPVGTKDLMNAMRSEPTEHEVDVFKTHKFTVKMKAPSRVITGTETDRRISVWAIKDAEGKAFGHKLWCDVIVLPSSFGLQQAIIEEEQKELEKSDVILPSPEQASAASSTTAVSPEPSSTKPAARRDGLDIEDLSSEVNDLSIENTDYSYDTEDANSSSGDDSFLTDDEFEVLSEEEIEASMHR